jgi:hypothetical protein
LRLLGVRNGQDAREYFPGKTAGAQGFAGGNYG